MTVGTLFKRLIGVCVNLVLGVMLLKTANNFLLRLLMVESKQDLPFADILEWGASAKENIVNLMRQK